MTEIKPDLPESPFLTVKEAARYARVSKMTIYRLVSSKELPAIHIVRSIRIRQDHLDAYLKIQEED